MKSRKRPVTVTEDQVALILGAMMVIERWDGFHPSISNGAQGGWQMKRVNGMVVPCPSDALLNQLKGMK